MWISKTKIWLTDGGSWQNKAANHNSNNLLKNREKRLKYVSIPSKYQNSMAEPGSRVAMNA